jgi:integrase
VTDAFARLAYGAGLPPIRLHDLRHGAATLMIADGADMKLVQALLRHSFGTAEPATSRHGPLMILLLARRRPRLT